MKPSSLDEKLNSCLVSKDKQIVSPGRGWVVFVLKAYIIPNERPQFDEPCDDDWQARDGPSFLEDARVDSRLILLLPFKKD
ncbi:Hypothetical protein NTJ_03620 [Nesidiocoris tenuis]|uniref:Uncharacterized protein n=1 Tax=Nesidiocoris tenuis TaxID=355587 RepID=A0ABN7AHQ1_9HEMI|nr:Hypothetical protein NTJ_03620 [Nesidiocoris tenuis]